MPAAPWTNDCQPLIDRGCTPVSSQCVDPLPSGGCDMSERTYSCPASPATQSQRTVCDQRSFCQGGANCFDTSNPADQDFGKAMASMEAAREAGVCGADQRLFKGMGELRRKKLFGLVDCCKKGGGGAARSNHNLMAATMQGVMIGGQLAINAGSKYMFDFMYPGIHQLCRSRCAGHDFSEVLFTPTNFQPSFTFYGLTFSTGVVSSGLLGGPIYSLGSLGSFTCTSIPIPWRRPSRCNYCRNCFPASNLNSFSRCIGRPTFACMSDRTVRLGCPLSDLY